VTNLSRSFIIRLASIFQQSWHQSQWRIFFKPPRHAGCSSHFFAVSLKESSPRLFVVVCFFGISARTKPPPMLMQPLLSAPSMKRVWNFEVASTRMLLFCIKPAMKITLERRAAAFLLAGASGPILVPSKRILR